MEMINDNKQSPTDQQNFDIKDLNKICNPPEGFVEEISDFNSQQSQLNQKTDLNDTALDYRESLKATYDDWLGETRDALIDEMLKLEEPRFSISMVEYIQSKNVLNALLYFLLHEKNDNEQLEAKIIENSQKVSYFLSSSVESARLLLESEGDYIITTLLDRLCLPSPSPSIYHIVGVLTFFIEVDPNHTLPYVTKLHLSHLLSLLPLGVIHDFILLLYVYPSIEDDSTGYKYNVSDKILENYINKLVDINIIKLLTVRFTSNKFSYTERSDTCQLFISVMTQLCTKECYKKLVDLYNNPSFVDTLFQAWITTGKQSHESVDSLEVTLYRNQLSEAVQMFFYYLLYPIINVPPPTRPNQIFGLTEDIPKKNLLYALKDVISSYLFPYLHDFYDLIAGYIPADIMEFSKIGSDPKLFNKSWGHINTYTHSLIIILLYALQIITKDQESIRPPRVIIQGIVFLLFAYPKANIINRTIVDIFVYIFMRKCDYIIYHFLKETNFIETCDYYYHDFNSPIRHHIRIMVNFFYLYSHINSKQKEMNELRSLHPCFTALYQQCALDAIRDYYSINCVPIDIGDNTYIANDITDQQLGEYCQSTNCYDIESEFAKSIGFLLDRNGDEM
ncbi:hypothetical protein WA158_003247 [Blastocystis sp. Blastoise]